MEHGTLNGILKEVPKPVPVKNQPPTKGLLIQKPSKRVAGSVLLTFMKSSFPIVQLKQMMEIFRFIWLYIQLMLAIFGIFHGLWEKIN